ncbi:hypothetical protein LINPERHAP1_LOCUS23357 [Linum perenne]
MMRWLRPTKSTIGWIQTQTSKNTSSPDTHDTI